MPKTAPLEDLNAEAARLNAEIDQHRKDAEQLTQTARTVGDGHHGDEMKRVAQNALTAAAVHEEHIRAKSARLEEIKTERS